MRCKKADSQAKQAQLARPTPTRTLFDPLRSLVTSQSCPRCSTTSIMAPYLHPAAAAVPSVRACQPRGRQSSPLQSVDDKSPPQQSAAPSVLHSIQPLCGATYPSLISAQSAPSPYCAALIIMSASIASSSSSSSSSASLPAHHLPSTASVSPAAVGQLPHGGTAAAVDSAPALKACLRYLTASATAPAPAPASSAASAAFDVDSAFFDCLSEMVEGRCSDAQIGAFLGLLTVDRLTPPILAACARALREHAVPVSLPPSVSSCMDIVGTGGDGADSFNVSTASAFVVAASGVSVVKHGNRSSSSKCGSADLIEATGAALSLSSSQAAECVARTNFCFLFAQNFHPAMRHVSAARKQLGVRTVFNVLGPLSNPCIPHYQLTGVYSAKLGPLFAHSLHRLGVRRAMIVHGEVEGTDELSPQGPSLIWRLSEDGTVDELRVTPSDFGLPPHSMDSVRSGTAHDNVATLLSILRGEPSAVSDWVVMNASAALVCAGRAADWKDGVAIARSAIAEGRALRLLNDYIRISVEVQQQKKPSILETIAKHRSVAHPHTSTHSPLSSARHPLSSPPRVTQLKAHSQARLSLVEREHAVT